MAKVLRAVASSEPNKKLQSIMFLYAQRQEMVEKERSVFESSQIQNQEQMEECKKLIIYPLRVSNMISRAVYGVTSSLKYV